MGWGQNIRILIIDTREAGMKFHKNKKIFRGSP